MHVRPLQICIGYSRYKTVLGFFAVNSNRGLLNKPSVFYMLISNNEHGVICLNALKGIVNETFFNLYIVCFFSVWFPHFHGTLI